MSTFQISRAQITPASRLAALGLLLVVVLVLYAGVAVPVIERAERDATTLGLAQERLARLQSLAAQRENFAQAYDRVRARGPVEGLFIEASSPATASALLQERLKALIKASGASVTSLFALPAVTKEDHRRIALRILLTADTPALQSILHGIEIAEPVLVVEKLYVRARTARSVNVVRDLDVEIEILGFIAKQSASAE